MAQCNSCGSFKDIAPCNHCSTLLCVRCKANHEHICEENQKKKARGHGPTVIPHFQQVPLVPPPVNPLDTVIDALKDLQKSE